LPNEDLSRGSPIFSIIQHFSASSVLFSIFTFVVAKSILSVFSSFFGWWWLVLLNFLKMVNYAEIGWRLGE